MQARPETDHITNWLGGVLLRRHSLKQRASQIINMNLSKPVVSIGMIGREGTGKTTLAYDIAHLIHTESGQLKVTSDMNESLRENIRQAKKGYVVKLLTASDMKNMREVVSNLPLRNRILILDDVSFSKITPDQKAQITTIRHVNEDLDVLTILFYNFHYVRGLDKYLRSVDFFFHTSITNEELPILMQTVPKSQQKRISGFYSRHANLLKKRYTAFIMDPMMEDRSISNMRQKPKMLRYKHDDPFRLALFRDATECQYVVFPDRPRLGVPDCAVCKNSVKSKKSDTNTSELIQWLESRFSSGQIADAMRALSLSTYGRDIHRKNQSVLFMALQRMISNNHVTADDLFSEWYGIGLDEIAQNRKYRKNIPMELRESFALKFDADALKSSSAKSLDLKLLRKNLDKEASDLC